MKCKYKKVRSREYYYYCKTWHNGNGAYDQERYKRLDKFRTEKERDVYMLDKIHNDIGRVRKIKLWSQWDYREHYEKED